MTRTSLRTRLVLALDCKGKTTAQLKKDIQTERSSRRLWGALVRMRTRGYVRSEKLLVGKRSFNVWIITGEGENYRADVLGVRHRH